MPLAGADTTDAGETITMSRAAKKLAELGLTVEEFGFVINKDSPAAAVQDADKIIRFGPQIQNFSRDILLRIELYQGHSSRSCYSRQSIC